ncbi:hypothetical protein ABZ639_24225 [Saccharomonospora sp. NPDC006951]
MDTTRLRELVTTDGPFASVYFDDTHDTADAAKLLELRWREVREQLEGQGAEAATLDALEASIREGPPPEGQGGRAMVAAGDRVLVDRQLDQPPTHAVARLSPLPYLVPLAEFGERPPTYVLAIVDSVGADVTTVDEQGNTVDERTVEGADHPVHKVRGGGPAHHDMQARADETTKQNVERAAEYVTEAARKAGATLVIIAGETQSRRHLHDALPERVRGIATEVTGGGRHKGADHGELKDQVGRLLQRTKQARRDEIAERFRAALGRPRGLAVQGLEATTSALREANVETLLFDSPADVDVVKGEQATLVAVQEDALKAVGSDIVTTQRADEALVFAAIAADADIVHTGETLGLTEGFGAILRHE